MEESYIKLFRKLLKWEWADDPNMVALWLRLLLEANYKPIKWHGITIERGQLVLSMSDLAKRTGVTNRNLRTCIQRLVDGEQIIKKSTNKFTILTICKYDEYQSFEQVERQTNDKRTTNERQTNDKRTTTIKEYKESKEREEDILKPPFIPPTLDELEAYIESIGSHIDAEDFINYYEATDWKVQGKPMKNWKLTVQTWTKKDRAERPSAYDPAAQPKGEPVPGCFWSKAQQAWIPY